MKFIRPLSQTTLISDANLVSYWPLDGNANDYKNVNNGTSTAVIYGGQYAQFGQGGYFNGNSSYIDVGNNASLQLGAGPFTISAWFKKAANGTVGSIYHDNAGTSNYYSIGTNSNNTLFLYVAGDSGYTVLVSTTSTITDTNWHLLTCVIESSTSRKIYLDGVLNVTNTTNIVGSISSNRTKNIGRNTSNVEYFNGSIDDVSIFNRALTATEVAYLAAGETFINNRPLADTRFFTDANLMAYWKFDGNSNDSKGSYNGTDTAITYGSQYGIFNQGALFNGSSSNINFNAKVNPIGAKTMALWFNSLYTANYQYVYDDCDGSTANTGTTLATLITTGQFQFWSAKGTSGTQRFAVNSTMNICDGYWHHIVCTWDGTTTANMVKMYVDGVLNSTGTSAAIETVVSTQNSVIGKPSTNTPYYTNGKIDDFAIFNRALSAMEVSELYEIERIRAIYRPLEQTRFRNDDNLLSYWKLDGNSNDSKGSNNGTDTAISYIDGLFNKIAVFNGTSSYIGVANNVGLQLISFSCSFWFRTTSTATTLYIIYKGSTTAEYISVYLYQGRLTIENYKTGVYDKYARTDAAFNDGKWHHGVAVRDAGVGYAVYIDGVYVAQTNSGTDAYTADVTTDQFRIGARNNNDGWFNGYLDDIALFNRALSRDEVAEIYQSQTIGEIQPLSYKPQGGLYATSLINDANLVSYWKMDGNSRDSKGSNHGTDTAMVYGGAYGKFGQGASFNGSSSKIVLPNITTGTYSFSCWFKANAFSPGNYIYIQDNTDAPEVRIYVDANGLTLVYYSFGAYQATITTVLPNSTGWHHVVGIWATNDVRLYLDGILVGSDTSVTLQTATTVNHSIGWYSRTATFFNGYIEDAALFNRALTASEVFEIYSKGESSPFRPLDVVPDLRQDANLLSYWKLNGDAIDSKGTKNGTASNVTYTTGVNGRFGQSGLFNGSSSRITASLATTAADNFTVSVWVNPANLSQLGTFVCNGGDSGVGCDGWWIGIGNGSGGAGAMLQALCPCVAWINTGYTFPSANTWYHVVMVRRSGTMYFFINGTQQSTTSATAPITPATETSIGGLSGARYFNGKLDDITIFNRALTNAEIYQLYTQGSTVGYWKLDGSSTDSSGNGNHGTDTAVTYAQANGVFNQGGLFNGTSSVINCGNASNLQLNYLTVSAWIKTSNAGDATRAIVVKSGAYGLFLNYNIFAIYDWKAASFRTTSLNLADGNWHHVAVSFQSGITNGTILYVDGVSVLTTSYTTNSQATNLAIGLNIGSSQYFNGSIEEVIIESRIWSAVEVKKYYTSKSPARIALPTTSIPTSGLVMNLDAGNAASYPGSGTVWTDLSPSALTFNSAGTFPTYEVKNGYPSFAFNGSGYWYCGTNYGLVDLGGDFTLILWLFGENVTTRKTIFEKAGTSYQSYQQELAMTWEDDESMSYYSRYSPDYDYGSAPAGTMPTNGWIMFSLKISSGKTSAARVGSWSKNGSNWTEAYTSRSSTAVLASGQIRIGTGYAGTMDNGNVAMAIAYNRLLSNAEISQIYVATASKFVM